MGNVPDVALVPKCPKQQYTLSELSVSDDNTDMVVAHPFLVCDVPRTDDGRNERTRPHLHAIVRGQI